jgi:hypothetical protein
MVANELLCRYKVGGFVAMVLGATLGNLVDAGMNDSEIHTCVETILAGIHEFQDASVDVRLKLAEELFTQMGLDHDSVS